MSNVQTSTDHVGNLIYEIVSQIAEAEGIDPLELTPPVSKVIDTDALGRIFANTSTADRVDSHVIFLYNGYEVTVRSDGDVSVEEGGG